MTSQAPPEPQRPAMLTVKQAARALGVNVQTIRRAADRGEILAVRIGAKILIPRKEFCEQYRLADDYDFGAP